MKRVVVTGAVGAGKTTLASRLSRALGCPHVELDALYWKPGWVRADSDEFRAAVEAATSSDLWVVDGHCDYVLESAVLERADELVLLDVPRHVIIPWVVGRQVGCVLLRTELWNGNRARLSQLWRDESLVRSAVRSTHRHELFFRDASSNQQLSSMRFTRLRSRREGREWVRTVADSGH